MHLNSNKSEFVRTHALFLHLLKKIHCLLTLSSFLTCLASLAFHEKMCNHTVPGGNAATFASTKGRFSLLLSQSPFPVFLGLKSGYCAFAYDQKIHNKHWSARAAVTTLHRFSSCKDKKNSIYYWWFPASTKGNCKNHNRQQPSPTCDPNHCKGAKKNSGQSSSTINFWPARKTQENCGEKTMHNFTARFPFFMAS